MNLSTPFLRQKFIAKIACALAVLCGISAGVATAKGLHKASQSWTWFAGADFGIRSDDQGDGGFRADRGGRIHKGVDFLMPVGTPLYAPCNGTSEVGYDTYGYGDYVIAICPLPADFADGESVQITMLYGHLSDVVINNGQQLKRGELLGYSGKSGNAASDGVNPHLHFETLLEGPAGDVDVVLEKLQKHCLNATGLRANNGIATGINIDPFVVFSCFANDKPALQKPWFQNTFLPWSSDYAAQTFDVNVGQR